MLVGKQCLSMKQRWKIYLCFIRTVLLNCCKTRELSIANEARLRGMQFRMIRMMCEVRLDDRVSTDVLRDRVGVVVKIEDNSKLSVVVWSWHAWIH